MSYVMPKRSRRLEQAVSEVNGNREKKDQITTQKFKLFCETRWAEKHSTLNNFDIMYEAILICLSAICDCPLEWDSKTKTEAFGFKKNLSDSTFIAAFQSVIFVFGYTSGLCRKLQGSTLDVIQAFTLVDDIKKVLATARCDEEQYEQVYEKMCNMAKHAHLDGLTIPRRCGRQTLRDNVEGDTAKVYFKRVTFIRFLDAIIMQFSNRFGDAAGQTVRGLKLLPANLDNTTSADISELLAHFGDDIPSPSTFSQEITIWKTMWDRFSDTEKPSTLVETMNNKIVCETVFPNITKILFILLLSSVTSSGVERANSTLRFIKNNMRSTMGEDRFNALILLYVHKDIPLPIDAVIDMYAGQYPRRMLFINPLS